MSLRPRGRRNRPKRQRVADNNADLVAAIDRLAAATLTAALVQPDFSAQKVQDTYKHVLDSVIHEGRDLAAKVAAVQAMIGQKS